MAVIDKDFVKVYRRKADGSFERQATLAWGDTVELLPPQGDAGSFRPVRCPELFEGRPDQVWYIKGPVPLRAAGAPGILRLTMVDVQQGDGLVIETPETRQIILVDGGDNKLFARHLAARFLHRNSGPAKRLPIDAIIVTHGDGDHFDGLNDIRRSEELPQKDADGRPNRKRIFIRPARVLHNGLVKRPSGGHSDAELLGPTRQHAGRLYASGLVDDPRHVPESERNQYFDAWCKSLDHWEAGGPAITLRRLHADQDPADVFGFLDPSLTIDILGPFEEPIPADAGPGTQAALRFFAEPRRSAVLHLEHGSPGAGSPSTAHTINGHSIALRLSYGNLRIALTGDMNQEAMAHMIQALEARHGPAGAAALLEAEVVKAPHHGSADFSLAVLTRMRPVVALVSSGDESELKEYIHPRATLMAGLGQAMAGGDAGLVFVSELAAFFKYRKTAATEADLVDFFETLRLKDQAAGRPVDMDQKLFSRDDIIDLIKGRKTALHPDSPRLRTFESFERTNFGIVHLRSDGERVLVFTHSGKEGLNEAYRFTVRRDAAGQRVVTFADEVETQ